MDRVIQEKQELLVYSWSKNMNDRVKTHSSFLNHVNTQRLEKTQTLVTVFTYT